MGDRWSVGSEARFASYVGALAGVIGHADRVEPLTDYWNYGDTCNNPEIDGAFRAR